MQLWASGRRKSGSWPKFTSSGLQKSRPRNYPSQLRLGIAAHRDATNFAEKIPASCGIIRVASPKSSSCQLDATPSEANGLNLARWLVKLRCYLLSLLTIHRPDCEHCNARETCGDQMRRRLEELNWRTQPHSLNDGDHEELVGVFDSKPDEVVAGTPLSLKAHAGKKTA